MLRGREAVRAQSVNSDKINLKPCLFLTIARPLAATKEKTLLSLEGSNCASFKLPVDNIRAVETIVAG
jgi:hypothetical protein